MKEPMCSHYIINSRSISNMDITLAPKEQKLEEQRRKKKCTNKTSKTANNSSKTEETAKFETTLNTTRTRARASLENQLTTL